VTTVYKKTQPETGFGDILLQILHFARTTYLSTYSFCQANAPRLIRETESTFSLYIFHLQSQDPLIDLDLVLNLAQNRKDQRIRVYRADIGQISGNIPASACAMLM